MYDDKPVIGIVTALVSEYVAVAAIFPKKPRLSPIRVGNTFWPCLIGQIPAAHGGAHIVVVTRSDMGEKPAASCVASFLSHFPSIKTIIMVGIAGGIPQPDDPERHVRLGDVVVSTRYVIEHDNIKRSIDGIEHRGIPYLPSKTFKRFADELAAQAENEHYPWIQFIEQVIATPSGEKWERPSDDTDILFSAQDQSQVIDHPYDHERIPDQPRIFLGAIASGDILEKDPLSRDQIGKTFGVNAIEMECAGVARAVWDHGKDFFAVRGISDYCDSKKRNLWQRYAAIAAAAYTRALLAIIPIISDPSLDPSYDIDERYRHKNPFLGLSPFSYEHRNKFAGRQKLVNQIVSELIAKEPTLYFITGDSGTGKSSLARAGVLPSLEARYREMNYEPRLVKQFIPGDYPLKSLKDALCELGLPAHDLSIEHIIANPHVIADLLRDHTASQQQNLLVLDQFEEIFAPIDSKQQEMAKHGRLAQRRGMFEVLKILASTTNLHTIIIATMRADYLRDLLQYPEIYDMNNTQPSKHLSEAMTEQDVKDTIRQSLEDFNQQNGTAFHFELQLLDRLAHDTAANLTHLPLLQVTLENLWKAGSLRLGEYKGIRGAIQNRIDEICKNRSKEELETILSICLDLVAVSGNDHDTRATRRSRPLITLQQRYPDQIDLIDKLVDARLLTVTQRIQDGHSENTVEIIHDSLLDQWDQLREGIAQHEDLRQRTRFEIDLSEWIANGHTNSDLLRGSRLDVALRLRKRKDIAAHSTEAQEFIQRSFDRRAADKQLRRLTLGLTIATIIVTVLAIVIWRQRLEVDRLRVEAERISRLLSSASIYHLPINADLALLLAIEAGRNTPTQDADAALRAAVTTRGLTQHVLTGHLDQVSLALWSPDSRYIATASADGTASIWDAKVGTLLRTLSGHTRRLSDLSWSHDGKKIVTASDDYTARIWDADTGKQLLVLDGHTNTVPTARWSPDDKRIVTASEDGTARVWDSTTGKSLMILVSDNSALYDAAWSPNGMLIATAGEGGSVQTWDAQASVIKPVAISHGPTLDKISSRVFQVAWSPDSSKLAYIQNIGAGMFGIPFQALIWEPRTSKIVNQYSFSDGFGAFFTAWSHNGSKLALFGFNEKVWLWNPTDAAKTIELKGHTQIVWWADWNEDGTQILTAGQDATVRLWDAESGSEIAHFTGHTGTIRGVAWSPDNHLIATASDDKSARIWSVDRPEEILTLSGSEAGWSPDSTWLTSIDSADQPQVHLISISDERRKSFPGNRAAWNPDGSKIATTEGTGSINIWNIQTDEIIRTINRTVSDTFSLGLDDLEWSPDGKYIAAFGYDPVQVWSVENGREVARLQGVSGEWSGDNSLVVPDYRETITLWNSTMGERKFASYTASLSPDDKWLLLTSRDGKREIRDVATNTRKLTIELGANAPAFGFYHEAWSSTSQYVAIFGDSEGVRIWDVILGKLVFQVDDTHALWGPDGQRFATYEGNSISIWDISNGARLFTLTGHTADIFSMSWSPDGSLVATGSIDRTVRIWNLQTGAEQTILNDFTRPVDEIQWRKDGRQFLIMIRGMPARLFYVANTDLQNAACLKATRNLTHDEWLKYMGEISYRTTCPNLPPHDSFTREMIQQWRDGKLSIDQMTVWLKQSISNNLQAKDDPDTEARHILAEVLARESFEAAYDARLDEAIASLNQAGLLNTEIPIADLAARLRTIGALAFVRQGEHLAREGKIADAFAAFTDAQKQDSTIVITAQSWNHLCWWGSLWRYTDNGTWQNGSAVIDACNHAVTMALPDERPAYQDSRGIALALKGDFSAAIGDFEQFINYPRSVLNPNFLDIQDQRRIWVKALQAGHNPFDEATLASLRN